MKLRTRPAIVVALVVLVVPVVGVPTPAGAGVSDIGTFGRQKHFELGESIYLWGEGYFPRAVCRKRVKFSLADQDHTRFQLGSLSLYQGSKIFLAEAHSGGIGDVPMEADPGPALLRGTQKCRVGRTTGRENIIITDPTTTAPAISRLSASSPVSGSVSTMSFTLDMQQWATVFVHADIQYEFQPGRWESVATVTRNHPYDGPGTYRYKWRARLGPPAPAGHYRFAVDLTRYTHSYGDQISTDYTAEFYVAESLDRGLVRPVDAQVNHAGMLIAASQGRTNTFADDVLRVFDERGAMVATYTAGLKSPKDVGFAPDDTIYVADSGNFRIARLDATGQAIPAFGSAGTGAGQFSPNQGPQGIAVTGLNGGRVYVADGDQAEIEVFDLNGNYISTITGRDLDDPFSVAVAPDGSIWVADAGTDVVSHFSSTGAPLGTLTTDFTQPFAVEVDEATERIYVSDDVSNVGVSNFFFDQVYVYDLTGQLLTSFGGPLFDGGAGGIAAAGLAGDVYVVHPDGNRILRLRFP